MAALGELAEKSALCMHAAALAAGLVYWSCATVNVIHAVRDARAAGRLTYFTIDAGPHVKVIVPGAEVEARAREFAQVPGVLRTMVARPGGDPLVTVLE